MYLLVGSDLHIHSLSMGSPTRLLRRCFCCLARRLILLWCFVVCHSCAMGYGAQVFHMILSPGSTYGVIYCCGTKGVAWWLCRCCKNQGCKFELCLWGNVFHFGALDFVYSHCFLLIGLFKLHHLPILYYSLYKSFFLYVAISTGTLRILASTLKSSRSSTIMRFQFLLSMLLLSVAGLATAEDSRSGVFTPPFLIVLTCSYKHLLIKDANHRKSNQTARGKQENLPMPFPVLKS